MVVIPLLLFCFFMFYGRVFLPTLAFLRTRRRMHKMTAAMPGPASYPIIGSGHMFLGRDGQSIFNEIQKQLTIYQSPAKMWSGPLLIVLIDNPEDLQVVLTSPHCLEKASIYKFFGCSQGLFAAPVDMWRVHRRHLNLCFSLKTLQSYVGTLNEKARKMVTCLEREVGAPEFDVLRYTATSSLAMILATNLQTNVDVQNREGEEIFDGIEGLAEALNSRIFSFWKYPSVIYKLTDSYRREEESWTKIRRILKLIDSGGAYEKVSQTEEDLWPYLKRLMTVRAVHPEAFSEESIVDEIITVLAGGTETSATTLAFIILMLAMRPDVQEKVFNEVQSLTRNGTNEPDWEALSQLTYMEMVIKETMRIFSPGPIVGREATADLELKNYTIPKGAQLLISTYSVHRSSKLWEKPNEFYPEHFTEANAAGRHPYSYIPFSGGPRNCIGMKYAWVSMKITLWHLVKSYKFSTSLTWEDLKLKLNITLKLVNRHMVTVTRR